MENEIHFNLQAGTAPTLRQCCGSSISECMKIMENLSRFHIFAKRPAVKYGKLYEKIIENT